MTGYGTPTATLLAEYKRFTKDSSSANETIGKDRIQHIYNQLAEQVGNQIVEKTKYGDLKDGQRSYLLPPDYIMGSLKDIRVKVSSQWYPVDTTENNDLWHMYATNSTDEANIPKLARVMNNDGQLYLELDPIPDTDLTDALEIVFDGYLDPLSFPNIYATGTISVSNGGTTITGSGTTFTSSMARRFIKPTGAKYWYEIKTFNSTTGLTLVNNYQEATVSGVTFQIAELLRLPTGLHYAPVYGAAEIYYRPTNGKKADEYSSMYAREMEMGANKRSKTKGGVMVGKPVGVVDYRVPRNYPKQNLTMI